MSRVCNEYPDGTRYVVEAHGAIVKRYVEYPDGRRVKLRDRKAHRCNWAGTIASIVPDQIEQAGAQAGSDDRRPVRVELAPIHFGSSAD